MDSPSFCGGFANIALKTVSIKEPFIVFSNLVETEDSPFFVLRPSY